MQAKRNLRRKDKPLLRRLGSGKVKKSEYVVVTRKALKKREIGFAYRIVPESMKDSGWRMMHDRNENKLDLANPDKVYVCNIKDLLKYFPEIEEFLGESKYTVVEKISGRYQMKKSDKNVSDVPFRMTGKKKYGVVLGFGGSGGGVIFTPNSKAMRRGYNEWEQIVKGE